VQDLSKLLLALLSPALLFTFFGIKPGPVPATVPAPVATAAPQVFPATPPPPVALPGPRFWVRIIRATTEEVVCRVESREGPEKARAAVAWLWTGDSQFANLPFVRPTSVENLGPGANNLQQFEYYFDLRAQENDPRFKNGRPIQVLVTLGESPSKPGVVVATSDITRISGSSYRFEVVFAGTERIYAWLQGPKPLPAQISVGLYGAAPGNPKAFTALKLLTPLNPSGPIVAPPWPPPAANREDRAIVLDISRPELDSVRDRLRAGCQVVLEARSSKPTLLGVFTKPAVLEAPPAVFDSDVVPFRAVLTGRARTRPGPRVRTASTKPQIRALYESVGVTITSQVEPTGTVALIVGPSQGDPFEVKDIRGRPGVAPLVVHLGPLSSPGSASLVGPVPFQIIEIPVTNAQLILSTPPVPTVVR
jgi:hypothetical protein